MLTMPVRRVPFSFTEKIPFMWNPRMPKHSIAMNRITFATPAFERYIVRVMNEVLQGDLPHPLRVEVDGFLRQEANHAWAHQQHANALVRDLPELLAISQRVAASYDRLFQSKSMRYHLAYIANVETTFAPMIATYLRHRDVLFDQGDPRVASLFLYHFVEEIEHHSVALDIYNALNHSSLYRARVAPSAFLHVHEVNRIINIGFAASVSDARHHIGRPTRRRWGRARMGVARRERIQTLLHVLATQLPGYNARRFTRPSFVNEWIAAFENGEDVSNWYARTDPRVMQPSLVAKEACE